MNSSRWLIDAPLWQVALFLIVGLVAFALFGRWLRQRVSRRGEDDSSGSDQEGYILTAVSGLLALLVGFTFSMAIDRFDTRRGRVLEEANAIEATYLKSQMLGEPYRTQMSKLLVEYTDNKIVLAGTRPGTRQDELLANNNRLKTAIWAETVAVFPTIKGLDFSSSYVDTVSSIMETDAARKAGRRAHVPAQVYAILIIYLFVTAAVFGYVLTGRRGREIAAFLLLLFAMSMILVIEIDRPVTGGINESQDAMIQLKATLHAQPPKVFGGINQPAPSTQ
jgi:hypothetical protein